MDIKIYIHKAETTFHLSWYAEYIPFYDFVLATQVISLLVAEQRETCKLCSKKKINCFKLRPIRALKQSAINFLCYQRCSSFGVIWTSISKDPKGLHVQKKTKLTFGLHNMIMKNNQDSVCMKQHKKKNAPFFQEWKIMVGQNTGHDIGGASKYSMHTQKHVPKQNQIHSFSSLGFRNAWVWHLELCCEIV